MGGQELADLPAWENEAVDLGNIFNKHNKRKSPNGMKDDLILRSDHKIKSRLFLRDKERRCRSPFSTQHHAHPHIAKFLSIPRTEVSKCPSTDYIQPGQGKGLLHRMPYQQCNDQVDKEKLSISLSLPILIDDTPESIGMKIPNRQSIHPNHGSLQKGFSTSSPLTIRDLAKLVGESTRVRMVDIATQKEISSRYYFAGLVEYFEHNVHRHRYAALRPRSNQSTDEGEKSKMTTNVKSETVIDLVENSGKNLEASTFENTAQPSPSSSRKPQHNQAYEETRLLNQIPYDFSGTPLNNLVQAPQFVRDLDWIGHAWPEESKGKDSSSKHYPTVKKYCMTSVAGSYTDFHINSGGSSAWHHIVRGCKEFVFIPPSQHALDWYETWLALPGHRRIFFPEFVRSRVNDGEALGEHVIKSSPSLSDPEIFHIVVREGQTLYLPAGWIYAVYTPEDSIVFGENFMHGCGGAMKWQLKVDAMEERTKLPFMNTFSHFWPLQFYAAGWYLERLRGSSSAEDESNGHISQKELDDLPQFIDALEKWWKEHSKEEQARLDDLQQEDQQKGKRKSVIDFHRRTSSLPDFSDNAPTVATAVHYSLKHDGCISVENFLESLRTERDRVVEERKESSMKVSQAAPVVWSLPVPTTSPKTTKTVPKAGYFRASSLGKKPMPPSTKPPPPPASLKRHAPPSSPGHTKRQHLVTSESTAVSRVRSTSIPAPPPAKPPPPPRSLLDAPRLASKQNRTASRPPPPRQPPPPKKPPPPPPVLPFMPRVKQEMD